MRMWQNIKLNQPLTNSLNIQTESIWGVSLCLTAGVLGHLFAGGILPHEFWRWNAPKAFLLKQKNTKKKTPACVKLSFTLATHLFRNVFSPALITHAFSN